MATLTTISIRCPKCQNPARIPDSLVGRRLRCRACKSEFRTSRPRPTEQPTKATRTTANIEKKNTKTEPDEKAPGVCYAYGLMWMLAGASWMCWNGLAGLLLFFTKGEVIPAALGVLIGYLAFRTGQELTKRRRLSIFVYAGVAMLFFPLVPILLLAVDDIPVVTIVFLTMYFSTFPPPLITAAKNWSSYH